MAAVVEKLLLGSQSVLIAGASLNAMANNALVLGSAFDNTIGQTGDGYVLCDVELYLDSLASAATANTGFALWLLLSEDGTNYEDGGTSVTPARNPDQTFPVRAVATAQRITRRMSLPWGKFKPLLKNDGTGQAVGSNNNTILSIRPVTREMV